MVEQRGEQDQRLLLEPDAKVSVSQLSLGHDQLEIGEAVIPLTHGEDGEICGGIRFWRRNGGFSRFAQSYTFKRLDAGNDGPPLEFKNPHFSPINHSRNEGRDPSMGKELTSTLDHFDGCGRIGHLYDQLIEALVVQINNDGVFGMVDIPENAFAVLIESACRDDSREIGSGQAHAMVPSTGNFGIGTDSGDVRKGNFETAREGPEFVRASDVQRQCAFGGGEVDHRLAPTGVKSASTIQDDTAESPTHRSPSCVENHPRWSAKAARPRGALRSCASPSG